VAFSPVSNASGPISYLRHQCAEAEVDITLSSSDPNHIWFYNRGKRLVRIDGESIHYLEPKEALDLPWNFLNGVPSVVSLNNGL
jgi:hypothetical protein